MAPRVFPAGIRWPRKSNNASKHSVELKLADRQFVVGAGVIQKREEGVAEHGPSFILSSTKVLKQPQIDL